MAIQRVNLSPKYYNLSRAEAALVASSGEEEKAMFQLGIVEIMVLWGVGETNYITTSPLT